MKKILISTGGTGGHVIPALNLYEHLKIDYDIKLYTDLRGAKYIPKNINKVIFDVKNIPEKKYLFPIKIIFLFYIFIKSIIHLKNNKFDILISTGGYMSFPIALAANLFNIKIYLFEPNSFIGRSNKALLRFSKKILCYDRDLRGLDNKYQNKVVEISPILKKCFYEKKIYESEKDTFKILILGGSQASLFFSKNLKFELIKLSKKFKIEVTQQLSKGLNATDYKLDYDKNNIKNRLFFYEEDFFCKNHKFDLAISRSGASSLAELSHLGVPFIAIPFAYATDNHQFLNAKKYSDLNCCWILEEKNFNSGDIYKLICEIIVNKNNYIEKKNNLKKLNENKSWENINKIIKKYLNEN